MLAVCQILDQVPSYLAKHPLTSISYGPVEKQPLDFVCNLGTDGGAPGIVGVEGKEFTHSWVPSKFSQKEPKLALHDVVGVS